MAHYDAIFKNGTVVNQDGTHAADLGLRNGRIAALGSLGADSADTVTDCTGLHILPGVIDTQVHFREPGLEHKEDLASGSLSAVMGGVTGVFEMPNTNPLTTTRETFEDKIRRATGRMHCNFAFFIGGTHENVAELPMLERLPGCAGVKVFMGSRPAACWLPMTRVSAPSSRRSPAAPASTPRTNIGSKSASPCAFPTIRPRIRSGATPRPPCAPPDASSRSRTNTASASTCCTSRPPRRWCSSPTTRTSRPSKSRRTI